MLNTNRVVSILFTSSLLQLLSFSPVTAQDSLHITRVGHMRYGYTAMDLKLAGEYAVIANGTQGVAVVRVSNPNSPDSVGTYSLSNSAMAMGLTISGSYVLVAYENAGLRIVNFDFPANPSEVSAVIMQPLVPWGVAVSGNVAYVGDNLTGSTGIVDLSNLSNPVYWGTHPFRGSRRLTARENRLYTTRDIIDISNPLYPVAIGSLPIFASDYTASIELNDDWMFVPQVNGFYISTIAQSTIVYSDSTGFLKDLAVQWNRLAVVSNDTMTFLRVYDVSTPEQSNVIGFYMLQYQASDAQVAIRNNYVYVAYDGYLDIFDISQALSTNESRRNSIPDDLSLLQLYPNPFNANATLTYTLPKTVKVKLELFDVTGRSVGTVFDWSQEAGTYSVKINSENLSSGTFFAKLSAGSQTVSQKFVVLK